MPSVQESLSNLYIRRRCRAGGPRFAYLTKEGHQGRIRAEGNFRANLEDRNDQ